MNTPPADVSAPALDARGRDFAIRRTVLKRKIRPWSILMPALFMYVIGKTAGGVGKTPEREAPAMLVASDAGFPAERLEGKLEADYRIARVPEANTPARYRRGLWQPPGSSDRVLRAEPVALRL